MGIEIERKFLVRKAEWQRFPKGEGILYRQGYIVSHPARTVRVRIAGDTAFLTIKGPSRGASRTEFEYPIPLPDAGALLESFTLNSLTKLRYKVPYGGKVWEVDEFLGENEGLLLAEIELESEAERFELPPWAGEEVTGDSRYFNAYLSLHPFCTWESAPGV